ncbi:MAG: hypothetical protein AAGK02_04515 [Pseudomonadota bacterium]
MANGEQVEGGPDPQSTNQLAAAIIAWAFLVSSVAALLWLCYLAANGLFGEFPEDARPELFRSWRWFNWISVESEFLGKALAAVFAVIAFGSQFYATMHRRLRAVLLICGLCIVGIIASFVLMAEIDSGEKLNVLRSFTEQTNESMAGQIRLLLGGAIAWYSAFLATQLGISWNRPAGAISQWLGRGAG